MPGSLIEKDSTVKSIDSLVTAKDIQIIARKATGDRAVRVLDYYFDKHSDEKIGFMGAHNNLKIFVQKSNENELEELNLFAKSIPYECAKQAEYMKNVVFVKEMIFFEKIVPLLMKDYKGAKWLPTCHLVKDDVLIMEDLRYQNFKMLGDIFDNTESLKLGLATVARFHSCSLLADARLKQQPKRSTLNEQFPEAFSETLFTRSGKASLFFRCGIQIATNIAESLGYNTQKLRISLDRMFDLVKPSKIHHNVIGHADLWKNNLLFNDNSPATCILIDYQTIRYAPLVLDILQFLYINTSREYRRDSEDELVEFYHSILEETLEMNDESGSLEIPTLEEVKSEMEDLRLFGLGTGILSLPLFLLDPEISEQCTNSSENFDHFFFGSRLDVVLDYMEKDEFYRKTLEETVTELVELSERLES